MPTSEELHIRAAEAEDIDALRDLLNLPGVRHGTARLPHTPRAVAEGRIAARPGAHTLVGFLGDTLVANAGLRVMPGARQAHAAEIGLMVHDDHVGQGIGRRMLEALIDLADNWMGLRRLELIVNVDNARAIRLYERCGFEREGVRRADILRGGELIDTYLMARLKAAPAHHG